MPKFQLAIFDFNGTLTEEMAVIDLCLEHYFSRFGLKKPSLKTYRQEITTDYMSFYYRHGIPRHVTKDEMNQMRHQLMLDNLNQVKLQPGALDILRYCKSKGMGLALVSGETAAILFRVLSHLGVNEDTFHVIYPDAYQKTEIFRKLLNDFDVDPDRAFYVDDIESGIEQANSIGIHTIGVCNGFGTKATIAAAKPRLLADHLPRVLEYLKAINQ